MNTYLIPHIAKEDVEPKLKEMSINYAPTDRMIPFTYMFVTDADEKEIIKSLPKQFQVEEIPTISKKDALDWKLRQKKMYSGENSTCILRII